jgi:hypothetical protein
MRRVRPRLYCPAELFLVVDGAGFVPARFREASLMDPTPPPANPMPLIDERTRARARRLWDEHAALVRPAYEAGWTGQSDDWEFDHQPAAVIERFLALAREGDHVQP